MTVETTTHGTSTIDRERLAELTDRERRKLADRTPQSKQRHERGLKVMPGGVPSSFQLNEPWPIYLDHGQGARVWDVDGNEYVDFHNGFGVMCIGHANPVVGEAVKARHDQGTHFAAPTDGSIVVAEELADRFGLPAVALHELGHRVDDGRRPPRPRGDRPRHDAQDRGLLPRPPRRCDGLRLSRRSRSSATATTPTRSPTATATRWR